MTPINGNLVSLYLSGLIRTHNNSIKETHEFLELMIKTDIEDNSFWKIVDLLLIKIYHKKLKELFK